MGLFFTDTQFVHAYVSRKKRGVTHLGDGTECECPRPPRLRSVEWIFTPKITESEPIEYPHDDEVDMDANSEYGETRSEDPSEDDS